MPFVSSKKRLNILAVFIWSGCHCLPPHTQNINLRSSSVLVDVCLATDVHRYTDTVRLALCRRHVTTCGLNTVLVSLHILPSELSVVTEAVWRSAWSACESINHLSSLIGAEHHGKSCCSGVRLSRPPTLQSTYRRLKSCSGRTHTDWFSRRGSCFHVLIMELEATEGVS